MKRTRKWTLLFLGPPGFFAALALFYDQRIAFLGAAFVPAWIIALYVIWAAQRYNDELFAKSRLAEAHEYERETLFQTFSGEVFRYWFFWLTLIAFFIILLSLTVYWEIETGQPYSKLTLEQTAGWGFFHTLMTAVFIGLLGASWLAWKNRSKPYLIPIDPDDPPVLPWFVHNGGLLLSIGVFLGMLLLFAIIKIIARLP